MAAFKLLSDLLKAWNCVDVVWKWLVNGGDALFVFGTTNNHKRNLVDNLEGVGGGGPWVLNLNTLRTGDADLRF
jgi:tRNA A58 N-methylase Trm61